MRIKLSIIIVHWNTPHALSKQLELIGSHPSTEIMVVDNNSKSKPRLTSFPHITYIQSDTNRGYASGCNLGATHAKGEWLLFLNPDTHMTFAIIEQLIEYASSHKLDACSPLPESEDYRKPLPSLFSLLHEFTPLNRIMRSIPARHHTLFGGGLLIKKSVLKSIGGWDERFFLWFEDSDITQRLLDKKYAIGWANITFSHAGGTSFLSLDTTSKRSLFFSSMRIYAHKHFGLLSKTVINMLASRYTPDKLSTTSAKGISVVVPNMRKEQLDWFLTNNALALKHIDNIILVTSALHEQNIWPYRLSYPHIRWILIEKNYGFAHTVNIGMRCSTGDWVGTMNDDVVLPTDAKTSWTHNLVQSAETYTHKHTSLHVGSINPLIRKPDNTVESMGVSLNVKGKAVPITHSHTTNTHEVPITNAACVLYNRKALQHAGIFDESFGSYLEDVDLSLRLRKHGYVNLVEPTVEIIHYGQQTSYSLGRTKKWLDFKNWILVIAKNWTPQDLLLHLPSICLERLRNFSGMMKG